MLLQNAKRSNGPQGALSEEWVKATADIGSTHYNNNVVGYSIAKGLKFQNTRCFNCGKLGQLRKDCYHSVTKKDTSLEDNSNRKPQPPGICKRCGKVKHWIS